MANSKGAPEICATCARYVPMEYGGKCRKHDDYRAGGNSCADWRISPLICPECGVPLVMGVCETGCGYVASKPARSDQPTPAAEQDDIDIAAMAQKTQEILGETGPYNTTNVQRRMRVSIYNAALIIDYLTKKGMIG